MATRTRTLPASGGKPKLRLCVPLAGVLGSPRETVTAAAHDLPELGGLHDDLAVFRTVENGFSLFRPDNDAVSVATDYPGRPVAAGDYSPTEDPIIVVNLPTRRANTFYTLIGDLFAWAAIAGFVTLSILSIRRKTSYYHK